MGYVESVTNTPVAPVLATAGVAALPSTGTNDLVQFALALGAGLVTWGVVYAYQHRG